MQPVSNSPDVTDAVYEALLDAICDGSLEPGQRLIEGELAQRLAVSRMPVHQALKQLQREGFLVEVGRRGLSVAVIDSRFAQEIYELRAALDAAAAVSAAQRASPEDRPQGEAIIRAGRAAAADGDLRAMATADFNFHNYIYQLADNSLIAAAARMNWHHVRRSILLLAKRPIRLGPFWDEHDSILQAVLARDPLAAGDLARQHAVGSGKVLSTAESHQTSDQSPPAS
jgi:DNA-binding GntR family transcriptional regulator